MAKLIPWLRRGLCPLYGASPVRVLGHLAISSWNLTENVAGSVWASLWTFEKHLHELKKTPTRLWVLNPSAGPALKLTIACPANLSQSGGAGTDGTDPPPSPAATHQRWLTGEREEETDGVCLASVTSRSAKGNVLLRGGWTWKQTTRRLQFVFISPHNWTVNSFSS